jgi:putative tricarboxylic transport membrane protein
MIPWRRRSAAGTSVGPSCSPASTPPTPWGKAKALAILEPARYAKLPNIPSMSEIIPAFRKPSTWFGFFGPAKLPPDIVARLNTEMRKAITAPEARAKLEESDLTIIAGTPEEFATLQKEGIEQFGEIIRAAGIPPQ